MRRYRKITQTTLSFLLAVMLVLAPVWNAFAESIAEPVEPADTGKSFFQSISDTYDLLRKDILEIIPVYQTRGLINLFGYRSRERRPTGDLVEEELTQAIQALNDFNASVLKDDKLAEALDEIMWEILEEESFTEGVQNQKEFVSSIIRDERLINILGEVLTDYLGDEQLADDIELFFDILLDLIADDNLQDYIKETFARLLEDERTARLLDGIISAGAEIAYTSSVDVVADLTADDRIKEIVKEVIELLIEPLPEMTADLLEDETLREVSGEIALVLLEYGPDLTADILEDPNFNSLVSDMVMAAFEISSRTMTGTMRDERFTKLVGSVFDNVGEAVDNGVISQSVYTLINDFFTIDEFREFVDSGFPYMMEESQYRAMENTPEDSFMLPPMFELEINMMKEIAWGVAEVPAEVAYLGFFNWLVYEDQGPESVRTYATWGRDLVDVITPEMIYAIGLALEDVIQETVPRLIDENQDLLFDELQEVLESLPYDETAQFIREDESLNEMSDIVAKAIMSHLPFDELAEIFREDGEIVEVIAEVMGELIDDYPLDKVGEFIREDPRIPGIINEALPGLPMDSFAGMIREDERITDIITEIANDFPVTTISQFLQGEVRADILGHTIADLLLNLVADFIENEQLSGFIYEVLEDILTSFDEPVAKIVLDNLARLYENDEVAPFLAGSLVGFAGEVQPEIHTVYKQVVPRFFTRLITGGG